METLFIPTMKAVATMMGLVCVGLLLKRAAIIRDEHRPLFSRLVMDLALPALVFTTLAACKPGMEILIAVGIMLVAIAIHLVITWFIGTVLHLERPRMGAFMLVAAFGSSSTIGYALISQIFPGNSDAITDAVVISELGVGLPFILFGIMIAMYYGQNEKMPFWDHCRSYIFSPLIASLVLGLCASFILSGWENPVWDVVMSVLGLVAVSLVVFVSLGVALMLRWIPVRSIGLLAAITVVLTLIVQPLTSLFLAGQVGLPALDTEILVLETAMPSGMLAAILSARYGCDGEYASALVIITSVVSLITLPLIMLLVP